MTDKPFDHEEYSRERLRQAAYFAGQTTPGDGSDFKGHLVHRPGRIEGDQQTIADLRAETERWQEFANGYMRDLTAAEQTIAELRKALADARPYVGRLAGGQHVGKVLSQGEAVKLLGRINALAAIAATEEGKSS